MKVLFEFADKHLYFSQPEQIIVANHVSEVLPALQKVQAAIDEGLYAAGYLSYEAAPAFDEAYSVQPGVKMPLLWFGLFREPNQEETPHGKRGFQFAPWRLEISEDEYQKRFRQIKEAIAAGDTYQVNYTSRLRAKFTGDDLFLYHHLTRNESGYHAYLDLGRYRILSISPELFFHWEGDKITTRPMKGTVKRGRWTEEDLANAAYLQQSKKERAENLMIVDLLRNDLGTIAEIGSVQVPHLFEMERYSTVHQMTSTITAKTRLDIGLVDLFTALFPCGSVTGAPKVSTMNWIAKLESSPREVYCGAIGYITPTREAVFNVPIRTVLLDMKESIAEYGVGGGITWDSTENGEYQEMHTKARLLTEHRPEFELLESLRLEGSGEYYLLHKHLRRLRKSAEYFDFSLDIKAVEKELVTFAASKEEDVQKVRLIVSSNGKVRVEGESISPLQGEFQVVLADSPIDKQDVFLYHKTTHRSVYHRHRVENPDAFDVLLWNKDGELTEFTIGNLVVEMDGQRFTPPIESGLLPGTLREILLETGLIQERVLRKEDLQQATKIWLINSVRDWIPVYLK